MGIAAAAAIGAVGAIGGGVIAASGAKSAANRSAAAAQQATDAQERTFQENKQTLAPYVQAGLPATKHINALLGLAPTTSSTNWTAYANSDPALMAAYNAQRAPGAGAPGTFTPAGSMSDLTTFAKQYQRQHGGDISAFTTTTNPQDAANAAFNTYKNSTGYQFRLDEGMDALNSGWAGKGMLQSGAAAKSALDYGQGMASQEFGNYMSALGSQQSLGMSAAGAQAGVATNYANSLGNIYQQNGANQANAALASANALGAGISGAAGAIGSVIGYKNGMYR